MIRIPSPAPLPALLLAVALAVVLAGVLPGSAEAAPRKAPFGFMGVTAGQLPAEDGNVPATEIRLMALSGVESLRMPVYWREVQPYARIEDVPVAERGNFTVIDGVPTDFRELDTYVFLTAQHHIELLPVVLGSPAWGARNPFIEINSAPVVEPYARFMSALVKRYGPGGSFWAANPRLARRPLRAWQIWNEAHLSGYWSQQPFQEEYVKLLRASRAAIKAADPGARIVLGGLTNESWKELAKIYAAGGKGTFDVIALHPFTRLPRNLVTIVEFVRGAQRTASDSSTPIWVTEFSWPGSRDPGRVADSPPFAVFERQTPALLRAGVRELVNARVRLRIQRIHWESWVTYFNFRGNAFDYSGLRKRVRFGSTTSRSSLAAYTAAAREVEGCRKTTIATRCKR